MKIHQINWLTKPSALWRLEQNQFVDYVLKPSIAIARSCGLLVGEFKLQGEVLRIQVCGPTQTLDLFRRLLAEKISNNLHTLYPELPCQPHTTVSPDLKDRICIMHIF